MVYLVINTINNLTAQDEQVACFVNAARHLSRGGCFVLEVGVPQLRRLPPGQSIVRFSVDDDHLGFDEYDLVKQGLVSHHYYQGADGRFDRRSIPFRYVCPSELDLMARIAGMNLNGRWSDWRRGPFTADSTTHVSVWQLHSDASRGR